MLPESSTEAPSFLFHLPNNQSIPAPNGFLIHLVFSFALSNFSLVSADINEPRLFITASLAEPAGLIIQLRPVCNLSFHVFSVVFFSISSFSLFWWRLSHILSHQFASPLSTFSWYLAILASLSALVVVKESQTFPPNVGVTLSFQANLSSLVPFLLL